MTITPSVVGVTSEEDEVTLGNADVYGVSVASTGKQYKVNEGFYSIGLNVMVVNEDNVPVIAYSDGRPMKVVMQKIADTGPDTNVDVAAGGSFTQEQADWNQSDDTAVDFIKNKPTIPAAQVNADWNAASGVAQILNKPTIPTVNDATLTFTQDGETLATFSANASTNVEVEIPAGGGGGGASIIETTWADLKALRDGGTLTPGQQYRITDYVYVRNDDTSLLSGNHPFDIIVIADSSNKLNEVARAALHAGDTYFANCKLEAWKLWYCIDNDTDRFQWANSTNGKGVIYRMIDEWNNDCPYDFKNVMISKDFKSVSPYLYTFNVDYNFSGNDGSIKTNSSVPQNNFIDKNLSEYNRSQLIARNFIIGGRKCVHIGQNSFDNLVYGTCNYVKIGNQCRKITASQVMDFTVEDNNIGITFTGSSGGSYGCRCVTIANRTNGSSSTMLSITDTNTDQNYKTTFFKETDGTLKKQEGSTITTVE